MNNNPWSAKRRMQRYRRFALHLVLCVAAFVVLMGLSALNVLGNGGLQVAVTAIMFSLLAHTLYLLGYRLRRALHIFRMARGNPPPDHLA